MIRKNCRGIFVFIVLAVVVSFGLFMKNGEHYANLVKDHFNGELIAQPADCSHACLTVFSAHIKSCLLEHLHRSNSTNWLLPAVQKCSEIFVKRMKLVPLINSDETKYVLLPEAPKTSHHCAVMTLGIGNDIRSEIELKNAVPDCQFVGADPIYDSGKIYEQIGSFYNMAVGTKDGNFEASVNIKGSYSTKTVQYVSFEKFLRMTNLKRIDYLFIDNEGPEYGLMPFLETSFLKNMNVTICQFNAEFHMPLQAYGTTEKNFNEIFKRFFIRSDFIPISAEQNTHFRTAWINILDKKCSQKYFPRFCNDIRAEY